MPSGKVHGKSANIQVADSGGTLRDFSSDVTSIELDSSTAVAKSTGLGSDDETFVIGLNDNKFSIKGMFDDSATTGMYTVLEGIRQAKKDFAYSPAGTTAGYVKITQGSDGAIMTDMKITSPIGGVVTMDANFQVSGSLAFTTN